jgi:hypothetical protein
MAQRNTWLSIAIDTWALGLEASFTMGLRALHKIAGGPAAEPERAR